MRSEKIGCSVLVALEAQTIKFCNIESGDPMEVIQALKGTLNYFVANTKSSEMIVPLTTLNTEAGIFEKSRLL